MTKVFVHSYGSYQSSAEGELEPLKQLVIETTGKHVRRIGRFIQTALIGAGRAAGGMDLPAETAVYLTSGRGDLEVTVDVMEKLFRDGSAPRPLNFINTVSNSACFYVARQLGLRGPSIFSCNKHFSFETALQLALLDFQRGAVTSALIGSIDIVAPPVRVHRLRLGFEPERPVGEGSHWYLLSTNPEGAIGQVIRSVFLPDRDTLIDRLPEIAGQEEDTAISFGQFLSAGDADYLTEKTGLPRFSYNRNWPYYDSQSGAALGEFMTSNDAPSRLVHIDCDPAGRFGVMVANRL